MTPFTLVMAYYENAGMLRKHAELLIALNPEILRNLHLIVIDDGSPTAPAVDALTPFQWEQLKSSPMGSVQVWRMGVDVRWNQDACRNIGVREARTQWLVLTDMDHVVPESTWRRLMGEKLEKRRTYRFSRRNAPDLDHYKPHPNSWALTRDMYWMIGGYDEALAGNYGTDGDFLVRARRQSEVLELPEYLVRYPREVIPDASTTTLERKRPEDKEAVNRIIKSRHLKKWRPLHFSFPCERLL